MPGASWQAADLNASAFNLAGWASIRTASCRSSSTSRCATSSCGRSASASQPPPAGGSARGSTCRSTGARLQLIEASAEAIPLDDRSIDTVVMTWTGCSIPDIRSALTEMRRVLRPAGRLLFVEHGRSPEARVELWQDRLTPIWRRLSGGCHLNRNMDELVEASGFTIERLETGYIKARRS